MVRPRRSPSLSLSEKPLIADDESTVLISELGINRLTVLTIHCPPFKATTRFHVRPARKSEIRDDDEGFDEFEGSDVGICESVAEEDEEADAIWESIDKRMASRRREYQRKTQERIDKGTGVSNLFSDLKRELYPMSAQEWNIIPEFGNYSSLRNKKRQSQSFVAVLGIEKNSQ